MRLLVIDEEIISGGVETLRRGLLPALVERCEKVVWVLPPHGQPLAQSIVADTPRLEIESPFWPPDHPYKWISSIVGRIARLTPQPVCLELMKMLRDFRIRILSRTYGTEACLSTCVFSQSFPRTGLPTGAIVCDLSPL